MKNEPQRDQEPTTTIARSAYLRGRIGWQGLKAAEFIEEGPHLVTGTDFIGGRIDWNLCYRVSESRFAEADYIHLKNNDVLITKDGTIGKVAFVQNCPEKAVLNSGIFLLRCSDRTFEQRYMFYLLQSQVFRKFLDDNLAGSTIQHLYQHVFKTFEFGVPQLAEQRKIANLLAIVDRAIEQTEALIEKQERTKTGLMQALLTRGIDEHGNLRSESTHKFRDSPLGRVPIEWEIDRFESRVISSAFGPRFPSTAYSESGNFALLRTTDLDEYGNIAYDEMPLATLDTRSFEHHRLEPSDLLISRSGTIGVPAIFEGFDLPVIPGAFLIRFRMDPKLALSSYWQLYFNWEVGRRRLTSQAEGGVQKNLRGSAVNRMVVAFPRVDEQCRVDECFKGFESNRHFALTLLEKLRLIKTAVMQDLLTGKKRVTPLLEMEHTH